MQHFFKIILSPMAFAAGFLWPVVTQSLIAMGLLEAGWPAVAIGAAAALPIGMMAQLRGSWLWIR